MRLHIRKAAIAAALLWTVAPAHALNDTYRQTFDNMSDGESIQGTDSWAVLSGDPDDAMAESGETASGSGKAVKLVGASPAVDAARPDEYGALSPTWIEYVVKPSMGADQRDVPSDGIAAVNFSSTGKIMVSDGSTWMDTGKDFTWDAWYRILLKLDFSTHTYDMYCESANNPESPFIAEKQNLAFIDPTVSTLNTVGFMGAYNMDYQADSLVDEVVVHTIDRLQFSNAPHTIVKSHASGAMTVQLQNANGEPQTSWRDMTFELRSSEQGGEFSLDADNWAPISSITVSDGSQQASFYYKGFQEGKPTLTVNEFPDRGWTDAVQEQRVVSEGEFFTVAATTPQISGEPFSLQITAMDGLGGTDTSYAGTVEIFVQYVDPENGTKILTPETAAGFTLGMAVFPVTYPDAGIVKIGVRDSSDSLKIGYSGDILFIPSAFEVESDPVQIVGRNFSVEVKALDKEGHVTPNYGGGVKLEPIALTPFSTQSGVFNPMEAPAGSFVDGQVVMSTAFNRWGTIKIKATDLEHADKTGESLPVTFQPKILSVHVSPPTGTRNFFYTGENMEISVSVLGEDELPIENFEGSVSLTPMPAFDILAQYAFTASDKGQKKFVVPAGKAGKFKLKIEDLQNNLSEESDEFEVKDATIVVASTSSPVGATSVEIQLVDSQGNRIKEENDLTITVLFQEENENGSVFFSELGKPILFKKGVAKIVIGDSEAETVTITARSKYGLKVVSGKVVFGRAGVTGVGALMLRESKD